MLCLNDKIYNFLLLRVQNYNVFKEISKVSTSWQVEKTAGLIMSQKWLSLVFILITRVLKNVFSMWSKELQSGSKKHNQTKSTRFLQMRSWHYHKASRYNVSCTSIPSDFRRKSLFANRENWISNSYKHMACDSPFQTLSVVGWWHFVCSSGTCTYLR